MTGAIVLLAITQVLVISQVYQLRQDLQASDAALAELMLKLSQAVLAQARTSPPFDYVPHAWLWQEKKEQPSKEGES